MLKAPRDSARAWTAVPMHRDRFDTAPSTLTAPSKLRTILRHYHFFISILRNETPSPLGRVSLPGAGRAGYNKIKGKIPPLPNHRIFPVLPYFSVMP